MRKRAVVLMILFSVSMLFAGAKKFDKAMHPVLTEYLKIHDALFKNKKDGVVKAAKRIVALSKKVDARSVTGEHKEHYKHVPMKLQKNAKKLAQAKTIADMRKIMKKLSKPLSMWVTMAKPNGAKVAYCSMVKGSWVQKGSIVNNPYDPKMPHCGQFVGGDMKKKGHNDAHKGHKPQKAHGSDCGH